MASTYERRVQPSCAVESRIQDSNLVRTELGDLYGWGCLCRAPQREGVPYSGNNGIDIDPHPQHSHVEGKRLVMREPAEAAKQVRPVMLATTDEWQLLSARIRDIGGDVPAVLSYPPERHGRGVPISAPPEIDDERRGKHELKQGTPEEAHELPERRAQEMTGLVNRQIDCIEQTAAWPK